MNIIHSHPQTTATYNLRVTNMQNTFDYYITLAKAIHNISKFITAPLFECRVIN